MDEQNNLEKIEKELQQVESEQKVLDEKKRVADIMRKYDKEDRVISSEDILEEIKNRKPSVSIKSEFKGLDKLTDGFREGNLITISGVTASGKTTLAQSFLINFRRQDISSLFFTYEVPTEELLRKFGDDVPLFYLPRQLKQSNIRWLEERIIEGIAKFYTKVIFIDTLHDILPTTEKFMNTSLLIGDVIKELKDFAIENNIIIFLLAHFKKVKLEEDEMPDVDNLRDSSFIGQKSDYVLIINRKKTEDKKNWIDEATLFVAKNRWNGKTGYVRLKCFDNYFSEIESQKEDIKDEDIGKLEI